MQLVRGIHNLRAKHRGCVLTIGNFDGVHLGHSRVISSLVAKAKQYNLVSAVMVFEPQPQEVFNPTNAPARLSRLRDKYTWLAKLGVERLICVKFSLEFASMKAEDFINQLLVDKLGVAHLIIGDDFHFGKDREGDFTMLQQHGELRGFSVVDTQSFKREGCRISSTEIRMALEQDNLQLAEKMLGRPYSIIGRVVHGDKKGRTLGFPTANVQLKRCVSPVSGVYAVTVKTEFGQHFGVANIGSRPTVSGTRQQLEVHLFDFNKNLYGQQIDVALVKKIRNEHKFSSLDELTKQINLDSNQARQIFNELNIADTDNNINE